MYDELTEQDIKKMEEEIGCRCRGELCCCFTF